MRISNFNTNDKIGLTLMIILIIGWTLLTSEISPKKIEAGPASLYLRDSAAQYVTDIDAFEKKVRSTAAKLKIEADWLMAVMAFESKFDASIKNYKGSGATGLIQFMPATAKDFGTTTKKLKNMNHVEQMDYVYMYLARVRKTYGDFHNLTDLYLAILYPKAIPEPACFVLFEEPSVRYKQNGGLDWDNDGRVTINDIDKKMVKLFPEIYERNKTNAEQILAKSGFKLFKWN